MCHCWGEVAMALPSLGDVGSEQGFKQCHSSFCARMDGSKHQGGASFRARVLLRSDTPP